MLIRDILGESQEITEIFGFGDSKYKKSKFDNLHFIKPLLDELRSIIFDREFSNLSQEQEVISQKRAEAKVDYDRLIEVLKNTQVERASDYIYVLHNKNIIELFKKYGLGIPQPYVETDKDPLIVRLRRDLFGKIGNIKNMEISSYDYDYGMTIILIRGKLIGIKYEIEYIFDDFDFDNICSINLQVAKDSSWNVMEKYPLDKNEEKALKHLGKKAMETYNAYLDEKRAEQYQQETKRREDIRNKYR